MSDTIRIDKKLFVISDLHFGDFSSRDNFHTGLKVGNSEYDREKQFYAFLDHVESQDGRLLILGDIFEFWQSNIGTVISKNKKMLDRLAAMDIVYSPDNDGRAMANRQNAATKFLRHET